MNKQEILFVAFGSLGDVYPLLAIAKKMQQSRKVTFLANEYFRPYVDQVGINFFPIGTVEDQLKARESSNISGETEEGRKERYENVIAKGYKATYDYFATKVQAGIKFIAITHGNLSPAAIACEAFNIPVIYTHYAPSQIPGNLEDAILCASFYSNKNEWWIRHVTIPLQFLKLRFSFEVKDQLNAHRKKLGLAPVASSWGHFIQKFTFKKEKAVVPKMNIPAEIVLTPQWFCEPFDNKDNQYSFVGFPFVEESYGEQEAMIDQFIEINGKPIVFTPGTAVEDVDAFLHEMIPICRKLGSPGIFCSKHGRAAFDKLEKADDVPLLYIEHAKFSHLLPKSRCLIHHGGIGTLAQAVRAGIPQIVRPRMYDQPANGVRVMMFGLGGSVFPEAFFADRVADILLHVENSAQHQEMLAYYSDLVAKENGVENCCRLIESFLNEEAEKNAETSESCPAY